MSTVIYPSPIFGPVHSRRLGVSLGINLMPADGKVCTFDCIYCECGFNADRRPTQKRPTRMEVSTALEAKLQLMKDEGVLPDVLTFAGNGEPTAHPDFLSIIKDTMTLRNRYCPEAKVSVLSNATLIMRPQVFEALMLVDNNILKLDTVCPEYIHAVNGRVAVYGDIFQCGGVVDDNFIDGYIFRERDARYRKHQSDHQCQYSLHGLSLLWIMCT